MSAIGTEEPSDRTIGPAACKGEADALANARITIVGTGLLIRDVKVSVAKSPVEPTI
jgi:hypothetical protein